MMTNKKRMINLLPMGIPPYIFYIYTILDSDARKKFNSPSPCLSPRRLFHNSPFTLRHAQGERLSSLFSTCRSPFVVIPRSAGSNHERNYNTVFRGERIEMRKDYGLIFFDVSNIFNMKEMTNVNRAGMPHLRCRYSSGRR